METDVLLPGNQSDAGSQRNIRAMVNHRGTPVAVTTNYDTINSNGSDYQSPDPTVTNYDDLLASVASQAPPALQTYKRRWYILFVFSLLALIQGGICNIWTVVADSVEVAFGWTDQMVALMQGWLYIAFLVMMFPASVLMDKKGIRVAMVFTALMVVIGTVLRCITMSTPYITWLAHIGHIFNGLASPVMYTAGPVISALWFPPNQRATATAISTVSGFAGNAVCFLVGPMFIEQPMKNVNPNIKPKYNETLVQTIRLEILHCRYVECAITVILFLCIAVYFPSRPPRPPSVTAALAKVDFRNGFLELFRRKNASFWLVALPYGFVISIYSVWTSLFDVNLKSINVSEREAGWLGFYGVTAGCIAAVVVGRIADVMVGHMKPILLCMNVGAAVVTFTFILIVQKVIPFTNVGLYVCVVLQGLFSNGSIPLFYELSIEATYPVAEVATSAVLNILYNIIPLFFLGLFLIPNLTKEWMNWVMYGSILVSFPMLLGFREQYRRLAIDKVKSDDKDEENDQSTSSGGATYA